ncbi:hypothetical protein N7532_009198 [Penicillium argentinense]|uniref:Uncharacterized protein n=1 Tax=Penicillium argentinense TaxID=1131581 RepID=A0A9W9EYS9_9EURO|nr:uncharacterized protein N7532_009198 [Penicillium argentinense]KAJ5090514.1 hypothetical protein N7532_009198 [Penicillium argentinense]
MWACMYTTRWVPATYAELVIVIASTFEDDVFLCYLGRAGGPNSKLWLGITGPGRDQRCVQEDGIIARSFGASIEN